MVNPIPAGSRLLDEDLAAWRTQINSNTAPGWTSYTPTWTASTSNPVIGNGTISGRYRRSANSDIVHFQLRVAMGSTTTYGSGVYRFTYPSSPAPSATALTYLVAVGHVYDASSTAIYTLAARSESTYMVVGTGAGSILTPTVPVTWANGDIITLNGWYQPV